MGLAEIEAYVRSRVGAVFDNLHADKIMAMFHKHLSEIAEPELTSRQPEPSD